MPKKSKSKVILDSNIIISSIIIKGSSSDELLRLWTEEKFILVTSEEILQEIEKVCLLSKIADKYNLSSEAIKSRLFALRFGAEIVIPISDNELEIHCRDKKDDHILGLALAADADYLITGDKDLLILNGNKVLNKLQIVTVNHFLMSVK